MRADNELGDVLASLGDFAASESAPPAALALAEQHHDDESTALALRGLCRAKRPQGRPGEAVADCERALPLAAEVQRNEAPARRPARLARPRPSSPAPPILARGPQRLADARRDLLALGDPGRELLALVDAP
jgi:hypothetical protein